MAMTYYVYHVKGNQTTVYEPSDIPIGNGQISHITSGPNGHIWLAGSSQFVYEHNDTGWVKHNLPWYTTTLGLSTDADNNLFVVTGYPNTTSVANPAISDSVRIFNGTSWSSHPFKFYPYNHVLASGAGYIATNEGRFGVSSSSYYNLGIASFTDTTNHNYPYINDVTCFASYADNSINSNPYGTRHGVFGVNINNTLLPDTHINCIHVSNGSYYIGTDSGLTVYNQLIYTTIDRTNAPLPSNKITCIKTATLYQGGQNVSYLYVGTDNGMAIYGNNAWIVFDTTNVLVSSFHVTDILPNTYSSIDTSIWVTTLGSGLLQLNYNGTYHLRNTQNGELEDDSLYYATDVFWGKCGQFRAVGTKHHGMAYYEYFNNSINYYYCYNGCYNTDSITESTSLILGGYQYYGEYFLTNAGILWGEPCGAIQETTQEPLQLKWYQNAQTLIVTIPDNFSGNSRLTLFDMLGRVLINQQQSVLPAEKVTLDVKQLPKGFYLLELVCNSKKVLSKIVID